MNALDTPRRIRTGCECGFKTAYPVRVNGTRKRLCMGCAADARSAGRTVLHEQKVVS